MTTKYYGSEEKFIAIARDFGKSKIVSGVEIFENPFKKKLRRKIEIPSNLEYEEKKQISHDEP